MFSDPLDCADVTPDMLEYHPMHKDACVRELAAAREEELERRHVCDGCGERAPAGSDPANFYCAACGRLTSRREDGTVDVQRIRRGTGEYETARAGVKSAGELPRITYPLNVTLRPRAAVRPDPAAPAASSSEAPF